MRVQVCSLRWNQFLSDMTGVSSKKCNFWIIFVESRQSYLEEDRAAFGGQINLRLRIFHESVPYL